MSIDLAHDVALMALSSSALRIASVHQRRGGVKRLIVCAAHVFDGETIGYLAARSIRSSRSIHVIKGSDRSHYNNLSDLTISVHRGH